MTYRDEKGTRIDASVPVLSANIGTNSNEAVRKSSHKALLDLEQWVLENGFIDLVKKRNQFAKTLGYTNFFDYSVQKTEHMTTEELFKILDDFEERTREQNRASIDSLITQQGEQAVKGYNFKFTWNGDGMRNLDPYVPFSRSLSRWVQSFGRLHIDFRGAELTLDLLDRKGKYQNGFCHGPVPCFYNNGIWVPAKVNFTSNAKPGHMGSGYSGINTLFHEGGHAAHFSNITLNAPCFSQEFAPTSMAYAETQSMFCDSLLYDADWLKCYARDMNNNPIPDTIIKTIKENGQPFRSFEERSILVVPYFEQALYALAEDQLNAETITKLARDTEKKILGLEVAPRPLLAIPHLLSEESACSYQGYLLANMAVYQTRAFFMKQFGYLTNNPEIGPMLSENYWNPGNSLTHDETIRNMTGEGFNAKYLADDCNASAQGVWEHELKRISAMESRELQKPHSLNATINIVDGNNVVATNEKSDEILCQQFEHYIQSTISIVKV